MKDLIKLVMEAGVLARIKRTGPFHVGITDQETIAAHVYRQTILAYFIAKEEGADVNRVLKMCIVSDLPETRVLDRTFVQKKYTKVRDDKALQDQLRGLSGGELRGAFDELQKGKSLEAKVTRDADLLEALVEAKEYIQRGEKIMEVWFRNKKKMLQTGTGKKIFDLLEREEFYWW